jgi:hypothetical protein
MIGYEDYKRQRNDEALTHRRASSLKLKPEKEKSDVITQAHASFPQINPTAIAERIHPWDPAEFKRQLLQAWKRYTLERYT